MTGEQGQAVDRSLWLGLEVGVARDLARRPPRVNLMPNHQPAERSGLILLAAHTVFPEAGVATLPEVAREEVAGGLRGELRQAFADYRVVAPTTVGQASEPGRDEDLLEMRSRLLAVLTGGADIQAALQVAGRVHLARAVRGTVPMVIAMACLTWYGAYVGEQSPSRALFGDAGQLVERWRNQPADRSDIETAMATLATDTVGDAPPDLLDVTI